MTQNDSIQTLESAAVERSWADDMNDIRSSSTNNRQKGDQSRFSTVLAKKEQVLDVCYQATDLSVSCSLGELNQDQVLSLPLLRADLPWNNGAKRDRCMKIECFIHIIIPFRLNEPKIMPHGYS
jgi:hypothetical protein